MQLIGHLTRQLQITSLIGDSFHEPHEYGLITGASPRIGTKSLTESAFQRKKIQLYTNLSIAHYISGIAVVPDVRHLRLVPGEQDKVRGLGRLFNRVISQNDQATFNLTHDQAPIVLSAVGIKVAIIKLGGTYRLHLSNQVKPNIFK